MLRPAIAECKNSGGWNGWRWESDGRTLNVFGFCRVVCCDNARTITRDIKTVHATILLLKHHPPSLAIADRHTQSIRIL